MFATDVGFLAYWAATATGVIPPSTDPLLVAWNWSYLVLDVFAAAAGLTALILLRRRSAAGRTLQIGSLALTHAAGLTALTFWALRDQYDLAWWLPNLWLTVFPIAALGAQLAPCPVRPAMESST
jgi:Family of unknown function (DUF5360)